MPSNPRYTLYTEKAAKKYPGTFKKVMEKAYFSAVITEELSEYISDTKSPQGLFAAAEMFWVEIPENARRIVVLDSVQDPGNVGTIIRTAEAFGIDGVLLFGFCADQFSPKTLRASMGSVFRMPIRSAYYIEEDLKKHLAVSQCTVQCSTIPQSSSARRISPKKPR